MKIKWPEKLTICPHGSVNPRRLCTTCEEVNETIDACQAAVEEVMKEDEGLTVDEIVNVFDREMKEPWDVRSLAQAIHAAYERKRKQCPA